MFLSENSHAGDWRYSFLNSKTKNPDEIPLAFTYEDGRIESDVMDAKKFTADYVSKYISLLGKQLHNDQRAIAPLRVSILCSQHNQNSHLDEIKSMNTENCCQYCLTPWKYGNYVLKTLPKKKYKNGKILKKHSTSFNMVMKCLVCLNKTSSVYKKNKILNEKSTIELPKVSTPIKSNDKISETEEKVENMVKNKPKKKKRTLYAGLNPLVFKKLIKKNIPSKK